MTLFERDERVGGHAHTVSVPTADGRELGLDTGFIVMNLRTYPTLLRLFDELDVRIQDSDMSFGVRCEGCGLEYAGARGLIGVRPQLRTLTRPRYLRMLAEIKFFHRHARRVLADPGSDRMTLGRFIVEGSYSDYFRDHFLLPLTGAIWSSSTTEMLDFPAQYLIRFFSNHGMLTVKGSPTVEDGHGGSRVYVERLTDSLGDDVSLRHPGARHCAGEQHRRARQRRAVRPRWWSPPTPTRRSRCSTTQRRRAAGARRVLRTDQRHRAAYRPIAPAPRPRCTSLVELPAGWVLTGRSR